jgi:hypothetical protein
VVWSGAIHRKSVERTEQRAQERVGIKFFCRHPVDCLPEGKGQENRIEMRYVIRDDDGEIGSWEPARPVPDVQPDERRQKDAAQDPTQAIAPISHARR